MTGVQTCALPISKSDPWRPLFHSASASPYGLRSSRTELYPLNLQRLRVGQIKPPKWAKPTCQKQRAFCKVAPFPISFLRGAVLGNIEFVILLVLLLWLIYRVPSRWRQDFYLTYILGQLAQIEANSRGVPLSKIEEEFRNYLSNKSAVSLTRRFFW